MPSTSEVSNTTVAILLLLVIFVSIIGTWTVLKSVRSESGAPEVLIQASQAEVRLMGAAVLEQEKASAAPEANEASS